MPTALPETPEAPADRHVFDKYDNVLVTVDNKTYLGQVVDVFGEDMYDVYFADNGEVTRTHMKDMRPERFPTPKRTEFLNLEFYFDGAEDLPAGQWKIRRMDSDENVYVCTRLTGGTPCSTNVERFDIGYVMEQVKVQHEFHRNTRFRRYRI